MMKKLFVYLFITIVFTFQANAQMHWIKDPGNPIFSRGESGSWDSQLALTPYVMYDGSIYQMWYSGYDGGHGAQTGYAYSSDGINWTRHPDPVLSWGIPGSWDEVTAFQPCVLYKDTIYKMWYCGHDGSLDHRQIGYATGSDSIHWTKYGGNPVLTPGPPGSWDDLYVESPEVLFIDGIYHMWYSGGNGTYSQIGHATSPDGITWEKDSLNPVLGVGNPGSWYEVTVVQPSVVFDGTMYHMWYGGGITAGWDWKTGYAYSVDGVNWINVSVNNPVMGLGDDGRWDDTFVIPGSVIFDEAESKFKIWYGGGNGIVVGDIGFAKSGLTKYSVNPVFPRGGSGSWDSQLVINPYVMYDGSIYRMWYSGYDGGYGAQTGYAYSSDGISWTRHPDPVLSWGIPGSWDQVSAFQPCVLYEDTIYKMWYCGHDGSLDHRQIGYATGTDTIHFNKSGNNIVLTPGPSGSWDDLYVESPEVLFINGIYHMWYSGGNGTYSQIGHATSPDGIIWEKDPLNPVLKVGNAGSWDDISVIQPSVVFDGTIYRMWYSGGQTASWNWKTGYAYSVDGINWIKVSVNNPVLGLGDPGSWDDTFVGLCSVVFDEAESKFKIWYGGGNGSVVGDIGFASNADIITSIETDNFNFVPTEFSLYQNYPNPFNPVSKIKYKLAKSGKVVLKVFDILGAEVTTLVNKYQNPGSYEVNFNASKLASGVYFYTIFTNNFTQTKKMILLK